MEVSVQTKLSTKLGVFETRSPRTLTLEIPNQENLRFFEFKFLELMKQSILSISESHF